LLGGEIVIGVSVGAKLTFDDLVFLADGVKFDLFLSNLASELFASDRPLVPGWRGLLGDSLCGLHYLNSNFKTL
jgi:hypothetical protein